MDIDKSDQVIHYSYTVNHNRQSTFNQLYYLSETQLTRMLNFQSELRNAESVRKSPEEFTNWDF